MGMKKLLYLLGNSIVLITLAFSSFGCSRENGLNSPIPNLTLNPTNEFSTEVSNSNRTEDGISTSSSRFVSSCEWPPVQIYSEGINSFFWADDSKNIIFSTENDKNWMKYDVEAKVFQDLTETNSIDSYRQPLKNPNEIAINFGINGFSDLYLSPDEMRVVFLKPMDGESAVFLKSADNPNVFSLGKIYGVIEKSYWIKNGDELLLTIDWLSPKGIKDAYVYRVDLVNKKIVIEIPNQPEYRDLSVIGVSPNSELFLYVKFSGQDRSIYLHNLSSKTETKTNVEFPPLTYQWLSDDEFFAVGYLKNKVSSTNISFYAYKYNISQSETTLLLDKSLNIHPFILNAALISPSGKHVAFIQNGNQGLFMLDCK